MSSIDLVSNKTKIRIKNEIEKYKEIIKDLEKEITDHKHEAACEQEKEEELDDPINKKAQENRKLIKRRKYDIKTIRKIHKQIDRHKKY